MIKNTQNNDKGFTIVELMIALTIMTVILLLSTIMLIQIGSLYTKGVNMARLQNTTRTIMADMTSAIQFSGYDFTCTVAPFPPGSCSTNFSGVQVNSYCVGTSRYSYVLNRKLGTDSDGVTVTNHVLWSDNMRDTSACPPLNITAANVLADSRSTEVSGSPSRGYDMVPEHMRLTQFNIVDSPIDSGEFNVDVWMAYGDSDLVNTVGGVTNCRPGKGSQFCAVSQLSTHVKNRLQ